MSTIQTKVNIVGTTNKIHFRFIIDPDGSIRSNSKTEHEIVRRASRDRSPINCFFKACDREASEKLLQDAYAASTII